MYWYIAAACVVAAVIFLLINLWWRKSIAQNYEELIKELVEKRSGAVKKVSYVRLKGKKAAKVEKGEQHSVLWQTNEGFPIDFSFKKKRSQLSKVKMTLKSVEQDERNRVFLCGKDRDSKKELAVEISDLQTHIKLPVYKAMTVDEFLLTVCGLELEQ